MSQTDHFIDEVTQELRRDQLYGRLRRWAPYVTTLIIAGISAMAYQQYSENQNAKALAAFGDGLREVFAQDDANFEAADFSAIPAGTTAQKAMLEVLQNKPVSQSVSSAALRELFSFQEALALQERPARREALTQISAQAGVFALLAQEQLIHLDIAERSYEEAMRRIEELENAALVSNDLLYRISQTKAALESGIFK